MAISNVPANVATSAMQAIPFSSMIGGPLKACIEAQAMAAKTSWEFIKEVGLNTDEKGQKSAVMVASPTSQSTALTSTSRPTSTPLRQVSARTPRTPSIVAKWMRRQNSILVCSLWRQI